MEGVYIYQIPFVPHCTIAPKEDSKGSSGGERPCTDRNPSPSTCRSTLPEEAAASLRCPRPTAMRGATLVDGPQLGQRRNPGAGKLARSRGPGCPVPVPRVSRCATDIPMF